MSEPKGKWLLICAWIVAAITLVITGPVAFVLMVASAENPSLYWIGLIPIAFLALIVWAQVAYHRKAFDAAQVISVFSIAVDIASVAYLAYIVFGMSFS